MLPGGVRGLYLYGGSSIHQGGRVCGPRERQVARELFLATTAAHCRQASARTSRSSSCERHAPSPSTSSGYWTSHMDGEPGRSGLACKCSNTCCACTTDVRRGANHYSRVHAFVGVNRAQQAQFGT